MVKKAFSKEDVATRLVALYFQEVARMGFKRSLDLDSIINSYFYSLGRLDNQESEIQKLLTEVKKVEKKLETETKEDLFPKPDATVE